MKDISPGTGNAPSSPLRRPWGAAHGLPAAATLKHAGPVTRPAVMPAGAVVLLSLFVPGLGSLLLRGRSAVGRVLWMNGLTATCAGLLALAWPLFLPFDYSAGGLFVGCHLAILVVSVRLALRDRRRLLDGGVAQASPRWLWLLLFWSAAAAALAGLIAAVGSTVLLIAFGGFHPVLVPIGLALLLTAALLLAVVVDTLRVRPAARHLKGQS